MAKLKQPHQKKTVEKIASSIHWGWFILVAFITFLAYYPSLSCDFVTWDDDNYLHNNLSIIGDFSLEGIKRLFSSFNMGNYHPLTLLSYMLLYAKYGFSAYHFHLFNLILHVINTVFVVLIVSKMIKNKPVAAIVAGFLFGLHPLHVESVTWISETKDVLFSFFYLGGIWAYTVYEENRTNKKWYMLTLLLFILSTWSKAMAVSFPLVLLLIDYWGCKKWTKALWIEKIPFILLSIIMGVVAIKAQASAQGIYHFEAIYTAFDRLMFPLYALFFYLYKMVLPIDLAIIYPYPAKLNGWLPWHFYMAPIVLGLLAWLVYRYRAQKVVVFSALFYVVTIAPTIQVIPVGMAFAADRYFYIPSVGLFFLVAYIAQYIYQQTIKGSLLRNVFYAVSIFIALSLFVITNQRTKVWENGLTLWSSLLEVNPTIDKAYYGVGNHYYKEDKNYEKAKQFFKQALALNPGNIKANQNLGNCYNAEKNYEAAFTCFSNALQYDSTYTLAYYSLGNIFYVKEDYPTARQYYLKALSFDNQFSMAVYTYGLTYFYIEKDKNKAHQYIIQAAQMGSTDAQFYLTQQKIGW